MAINVIVPISSTTTKVSLPSDAPRLVASTTTSRVQTAVTLDGLEDVELTDVQDGYTFIYDADISKWVASPVPGITGTNIDGGTY